MGEIKVPMQILQIAKLQNPKPSKENEISFTRGPNLPQPISQVTPTTLKHTPTLFTVAFFCLLFPFR